MSVFNEGVERKPHHRGSELWNYEFYSLGRIRFQDLIANIRIFKHDDYSNDHYSYLTVQAPCTLSTNLQVHRGADQWQLSGALAPGSWIRQDHRGWTITDEGNHLFVNHRLTELPVQVTLFVHPATQIELQSFLGAISSSGQTYVATAEPCDLKTNAQYLMDAANGRAERLVNKFALIGPPTR